MIKSRAKTEKWEELTLCLFLLACFLLALFKDLFPELQERLSGALFVAIFFVLKQIRDLRIEVQDEGLAEVFFATGEEFYSSAREAVRKAEREIRVSYFRQVPPAKFASVQSREYFGEVFNFARRKKGTVRRIVGVSNDAMAEWCVSQLEQVVRNPRYNIRVIETRNQPVEPMSVCLIDDTIMYMAFSGPTDQQLGGIREDAPRLVQFHQNRFDQLWASSTKLEEFAVTWKARREGENSAGRTKV
ncbi:hypothetical protein [Amycolatopsis magusensis]|uniref:Uncharacterized protein n=1 Tax=Amycolatopsis magusensis TaxID=882444 RepID=A0ABS4Q254_9PSEU|nr:hypothetical protein [Amycolatopsis magusensis]MBP2185767.1 hypothetical protein [Amycolatopsis magusensis]MDI5979661.1 hypothetical protein [Amycolatopsis magusensis]